jgi:hypothetical protein
MPFQANDIILTIFFNICAKMGDDRALKLGIKYFEQVEKTRRINDIILGSAMGVSALRQYDFRQLLANVRGAYWRKSCGLSPIGECPGVCWRMST